MIREELQRLLFGPDEDEEPIGFEIMQIEASCPDNASTVSDRAREALTVILSTHLICDAKEDAKEWETDPVFEFLEAWFYNSFEKQSAENEDQPSDNVRWFNDARDWFWWDAKVFDNNRLVVYITVVGFPISGFDLLRWLLISCGASQVEQGPCIDITEINESG